MGLGKRGSVLEFSFCRESSLIVEKEKMENGCLSKELLRKNNFDRLFKFYRMKSGKFGFHLRTTQHYGHLVTFGEAGSRNEMRLVWVNGDHVNKLRLQPQNDHGKGEDLR